MKTKEFEALVTKYERLVFTVCYQLVKDYSEAQNLTQETFLSAYQHIDDYKGDNLKPWFVRIASNKAKDYLKSAYHKRVDITDEVEDLPLGAAPSAEQGALSRDGAALIAGRILALEEPYHQVARLYFLEERTVDEIAAILSRPKKTVETQIYRAKLKLQKDLKERGF